MSVNPTNREQEECKWIATPTVICAVIFFALSFFLSCHALKDALNSDEFGFQIIAGLEIFVITTLSLIAGGVLGAGIGAGAYKIHNALHNALREKRASLEFTKPQ